jgi:hypothetical protein
MDNIKVAQKATVASRITDKTVDYSIAKQDIGSTYNEIIDLLGAVLVNVDLVYPIGFPVYTTSPFAVYISKVDNVYGDVTNQTNWLKIAGSGLPYLVADVDVVVTPVSYQSSDYYVSEPISLASNAGKLFDLRLTGVPISNTSQLGYAISISTTGAITGSSLFIKTDCNGVGMHTLLVDGTYSERLEAGATYLFSKTYDGEDSDGYVLIKLGRSGLKIGSTYAYKVSTGKTLINGTNTITLPLAVGLHGEDVEIILISAGTITVLLSGSDTLVNIGGASFNRPIMRFISDGVDKWYYAG